MSRFEGLPDNQTLVVATPKDAANQQISYAINDYEAWED